MVHFPTMKVFFLRHGESSANVLGICSDDPRADVHLTEKGIRQAEEAARRLADVPIDRICVSEHARTRETAEIVNRTHGVRITIHPEINDLKTGMDGRPVEAYHRAVAADPLNTRIGNGETWLEHKARVLGFIHWLRGQPERTVLVVAHGETLKVAAGFFRGLSDDAMRRLHFDNAEMVEGEI